METESKTHICLARNVSLPLGSPALPTTLPADSRDTPMRLVEDLLPCARSALALLIRLTLLVRIGDVAAQSFTQRLVYC
jgi:hypothetical protein